MAEDKEQARRIGEALMVCKYPDVCMSPAAPVPYMIVSNFIDAQSVATTVNATKDPTFTRESFIQGVIGDEGGVGGGVCSGTHAGGGACWAIDWAHTVRAEGKNVVRNGDPTDMNGQSDKSSPNTKGTVVYPKAGAPNGGVGPDGKPTQDTNPGMKMKATQYGWSSDPNGDSLTRKQLGAWDNKLEPDVSAALSRSAEKALGAKRGDLLLIKTKDGTRIRRFDDRTDKRLPDKRVDLYMPNGEMKSVGDEATVSILEPPGGWPAP